MTNSFDRNLARLNDILREYGCRGVRATFKDDRIRFDARFPEGAIGYYMPINLIHPSVNWVEPVAQEFIDLIQQRRREMQAEIEVPMELEQIRGACSADWKSSIMAEARIQRREGLPKYDNTDRTDIH